MTLRDEMAEDFKTMLADWGQTAIINNGAGPREVECIFDEPFEIVSQYSAEIEMTAPVASVASSDIDSNDGDGGSFTTGGKNYTIVGSPQPDGTGLTKLILKEA